MIYVVGSGPAGVACAHALLQQGLHVTLLDAGIELEAEHRQAVAQLQQGPPESWRDDDLRVLKQNTTSNAKGIPTKLVYGSDFVYRDVDQLLGLEKHNVIPFASLARGGLSNVWGSNCLPFAAHDIEDWPISTADLAPHYEAVLSLMPLAASPDGLADRFPIYTDRASPLKPSHQATAFLDDMQRHQAALNDQGIFFGRSRLAVQAQPDMHKPGCVYCGLCMYGCPYELIYNSASTLKQLLEHEYFTYIDNVIVDKLTEVGGGVHLAARSRDKGESLTFQGARVYLACGVLATTKILLESLDAFNIPVKLLDSTFFLLPLLRYNKINQVNQEQLYTLSQVYLELLDTCISNRSILLEVYTYNDLYETAFKKMLGPVYKLAQYPVNSLLSRLLIILGYLHSDQSTHMDVTLIPGRGNRPHTLRLEAEGENAEMKTAIKRVIKKLTKHRSHLRALPIANMLQITEPGKSAHCGGTFPMQHKPGDFQTDILGRPQGLNRVHVVDATTFPSVPATTITLTVMANAHRIASAFGES